MGGIREEARCVSICKASFVLLFRRRRAPFSQGEKGASMCVLPNMAGGGRLDGPFDRVMWLIFLLLSAPTLIA